jgi:ABC-type Fe3+-hydroxamate transport system substrate-binding protein
MGVPAHRTQAAAPGLTDPLAADWAGTVHSRAGAAPRIACLVPSLTELLFALDLDERVVARTGFCIHPRQRVKAVPKVGGTKDLDLERLRALAPSHLVVNVDENRREAVDAARAFVPHVIVTHPQGPEDNRRLYALFGYIFGRELQARRLAVQLRDALDALDASVASLPRERVLYLIWRKPWMTVRRDTYVAATLARAGWDTVPVDANRRYPELGDDDPAWLQADRILASSEPYAFRARDAAALASRWNKPAQVIDGEWTSWYGSRAIPGLRALAQLRIASTRERR